MSRHKIISDVCAVYTYAPDHPRDYSCHVCQVRSIGWVYIDPKYFNLPCGHSTGSVPQESLDPAIHALVTLTLENE